MHNVENRIPLDMAVAALIQIEDYASVAALLQKTFDLGIGRFEELIQILDS